MPMKNSTKLVKVLLTNIPIAVCISLVASYIGISSAGVPEEAFMPAFLSTAAINIVMAYVLEGRVDGILLGGGMVHNDGLVADIRRRCEWIAPVTAYPGEFELEAMAAGARRVLCGQEEPRTYTGVPVFTGFDD